MMKVKPVRRKILIAAGIVFGAIVFLCVVFVAATPLWARLGIQLVCLTGEWPHMHFVPCEGMSASSPTVTPLAQPALIGGSPIPVIADDDGSPDGIVALLYLLSNPNYDVRAVTVSNGEAHPEVFAPNLQQLLASLGKPGISVGAGRSVPLEADNAFPEPWRQASDDFWAIELPAATGMQDPTPAAQLMVDTIKSSAEPVLLVVTGPLTNLAEALRMEASIIVNIKAVYIMGGSINQPGNIKSVWPSIDNNAAEWNIWTDFVAAAEVFSSGLPLHLMPLDATTQVIWTQADLSGWVASGSPEAGMAGQLLRWMLDSFSSQGAYVWDLVTAVQATNPSVCPEVPMSLDIVTQTGAEQGRTIITQGATNIMVCLTPDKAQVRALSASILGRK
jgi:inosine-uridine nucleoside N-ribohydrolase